jgi:hypothetical protein
MTSTNPPASPDLPTSPDPSTFPDPSISPDPWTSPGPSTSGPSQGEPVTGTGTADDRNPPPAGIWHEPLGRHVPITAVLLLILGALLQGVDTWLVKRALDVALNDTETMSLIIATAIGLGSFVSAVGTGIAIRTRHRNWAIAGLLSWAALGMTVLYMRWNMYAINPLSPPVSNHVLGTLMLALFVAAGVMVMYDMQKLYNRARGQVRSSEWRIAYYHRRLAKLAPLANRLRREVALRDVRVEAIEHHYFDRKGDNAAFAAELRDLARTEILRQLGDESESGIVNAPHRSRSQPQVTE